MNKFTIKFLSKRMKVKPYMINPCIKLFRNDLENEKRTNLKQKLWAYRRGFISSRIIEYNLSEENYKKYISDLAYYRLYPINNEYSKWIDDKLTTKYVLSKYNQYLPQYYYYIDGGRILPSVEAPYKKNLSVGTIVDLLKTEECLALKQILGTKSRGFFKVEYKNDTIYVNGNSYDEKEFKSFIGTLKGYLVTEFIKCNRILDSIKPGFANDIRLTVIKEIGKPSFLAGAFICFDVSETTKTDSVHQGEVFLFCLIDIEKGYFKTGHKWINAELVSYDLHPDTKVPLEAYLPHWKATIDKVLEITDYLGQLSWMGLDVVLTDDGFKILEINSHQDIQWYQYFYPLLENHPAADFLNKKLIEKSVKPFRNFG